MQSLLPLSGVPAGLAAGPGPDVEVAWTEPDGTRWWGLGMAIAIEAVDEAGALTLADQARAIARTAAQTDAARPLTSLFGGLAFDATQAGHWPVAAFWLPACIVKAEGDSVRGVVTTWRGADEEDEALARRHEASLRHYQARLDQALAPLPAPRGVEAADPEASGRWNAMLALALAAIAAGEFEKVVPAREIPLAFDAPFGLEAVYSAMASRAPGTDRLCLRPRPGLSFLAASPEVLFSQAGDRLEADCLAGTAPRGADAAADEAYAQELLASPKERHEHAVVVDFVRAAIAPHASAVEPSEAPGLRRLATVQHLHTPISARIEPDTPLAVWLAALHPTPAVCGAPRLAARDFVRRYEGTPRGWYAGAIGRVGETGARFVVGLRSAQIEGQAARVWAGAGVVAGSRAEAEWAETARKAAPMLGLLCGLEAGT